MGFVDALARFESASLFRPALDLDALARQARAADVWIGDPTDPGLDQWQYGEWCPACGAVAGFLCDSRGRTVEAHAGRRAVAVLRLSRLWVPRPGEAVRLGPWGCYSSEEPAHDETLAVRFVEFRPDGEALVEAEWRMGGRSAWKREQLTGEAPRVAFQHRAFDALCLWPDDSS